jgi:aspartyl-tRNA(Asn)/glutamyl-tRNA(Gln) amidotransferase subunit A
VRDNALMLQVLAGHDEADPGSANEPVPDYTADIDRGVKGLRIGVIRHLYTTDAAGDPDQVKAIDDAVALLGKQGALVTEITVPALVDYQACGQIILAAESYAIHERWMRERPQDYGARCRERLFGGVAITAVQHMQAVRWREILKRRTLDAFKDIDVAITASSLDPACRLDDNDSLAKNYWRQARMPFNVTGQPGLVIPAGFSKGLPLSLQIVGHPFGEALCYRVGQAYEAATGWVNKHPAL